MVKQKLLNKGHSLNEGPKCLLLSELTVYSIAETVEERAREQRTIPKKKCRSKAAATRDLSTMTVKQTLQEGIKHHAVINVLFSQCIQYTQFHAVEYIFITSISKTRENYSTFYDTEFKSKLLSIVYI